jgi:hypothetical protein
MNVYRVTPSFIKSSIPSFNRAAKVTRTLPFRQYIFFQIEKMVAFFGLFFSFQRFLSESAICNHAHTGFSGGNPVPWWS